MASYSTSVFLEVLAFLLPIAIYTFALAWINRRPAPVFVRGFWDAAGLLFAGSGFFLGTMLMILDEFYLRAVTRHVNEPFESVWIRHLLLWAIYLLMLLSGCAYMLLSRMRKTMIYNVETDLFRRIFAESFAPIGFDVLIRQQRVEFAPAGAQVESTGIMVKAPLAPALGPPSEPFAAMEFETFPPMNHVTLHWRQFTPSVRDEIERELEKRLRNASPIENVAAGWLMSFSGLFFGVIVVLAAWIFVRL